MPGPRAAASSPGLLEVRGARAHGFLARTTCGGLAAGTPGRERTGPALRAAAGKDRCAGGGFAGCPRRGAGRLLLVAGGHRRRPGGRRSASPPPRREAPPAGAPSRPRRPARRRERTPATGPGTITVHVAGAVARPGVVQLPAGSRLHEAITAAGGATDARGAGPAQSCSRAGGRPEGPGADTRRTRSGRCVRRGGVARRRVPARAARDQAAAAERSTSTPPALEELGTLPRVGPVLAQRIVDWRQQHGRFKTVQELDAVDGIGPKLLEALLAVSKRLKWPRAGR